MNPSDQRSVVRVTVALMLAQSLSSAAYSSSVAVNQLAIVDMTGSKLLGGLPSAIVLAGSSIMAYFSGRMVSRHGRRNILTMGTALGLLGAFIAAGGVVLQSLAVFLGGLAVLGFGRGTLDQSRYVAAEITTPDKRARALSFVVWGATIGAVGGPLVAPFASEVGKRFGFNLYFGPMIETGLLYGIAGVMIFLLLAFDLRGLTARVASASAATDKARESARAATSNMTATPNRSFLTALRETPDARTALIAMVCGQTAMALMMSCVSIYMKDHNHGLADISLVISTHTFGMFFFSPLVGQLTDRIGRHKVILLGVTCSILGCLLVPVSVNTPVIAFAELLVGLGWSGCYVAGSTLLTDALGASERARLQGANDSLINIGSAVGSLSSGVMLQLIGIWPLAFVGLFVASLPALAAVRFSRPQPRIAGG